MTHGEKFRQQHEGHVSHVPHLQFLTVADEQACAAEAPSGGVAARAVRLADALCGGAAPAAAGAALLATQLLLAAEVAGDACEGGWSVYVCVGGGADRQQSVSALGHPSCL